MTFFSFSSRSARKMGGCAAKAVVDPEVVSWLPLVDWERVIVEWDRVIVT